MRVKTKNCPGCNAYAVLEVTQEQYRQYINGAMVQRAFPHLASEERERFLSGYCPTCWGIILDREKQTEEREEE